MKGGERESKKKSEISLKRKKEDFKLEGKVALEKKEVWGTYT